MAAASPSFFSSIENRYEILTAIDMATRFPELLMASEMRYRDEIYLFKALVAGSSSSAELLDRIRSNNIPGPQRTSLLKMFRRCVSPIIDTEAAKKIQKIPTQVLVENYGDSFKPIDILQSQMKELTPAEESALAALVGEYDTRGQLGYRLTDFLFSWFEQTFAGAFSIEGPRGAGRDVELSTIFPQYQGNFPCDFVIRSLRDGMVRAIGFARYDSTRGGAQSDDRTGGNSDKVFKAREFCAQTGAAFKIVFLADGPGLAHDDTWAEACKLDGLWNDAVRVTTLKTAPMRITADWLLSR